MLERNGVVMLEKNGVGMLERDGEGMLNVGAEHHWPLKDLKEGENLCEICPTLQA